MFFFGGKKKKKKKRPWHFLAINFIHLSKSHPTITGGLMSIVSQGASGSTALHTLNQNLLSTTGSERKLPSDLDRTTITLSPLLPAVASHTVQANLGDMSCVYSLFPRKSPAASGIVHVNLG